MSLDIRTPDPKQAKVFDVADPVRLGKIIYAGAEVSAVHFDDGVERNVPNAHLRTVEPTEVELAKPVPPTEEPPVHAAVREGQEAWQRLRGHSTWEDLEESRRRPRCRAR